MSWFMIKEAWISFSTALWEYTYKAGLLTGRPFCQEVLIWCCTLTSSSWEIKNRRVHSKAWGAVIKLRGCKSANCIPEDSSWYERNGMLFDVIYYLNIYHWFQNKLKSVDQSGNAAALCNRGLWYLK